jgi:hypothetical protein
LTKGRGFVQRQAFLPKESSLTKGYIGLSPAVASQNAGAKSAADH